jgi:transcriptional regulator with XRE-family HTH domain
MACSCERKNAPIWGCSIKRNHVILQIRFLNLMGTVMALHFASNPAKVVEFGRLLQETRNRHGLSVEAMCKRVGMSPDQIQAIEDGDIDYFKRSTQTIIWHARLYAKKMGIDLPELVFNDIRRTSATSSHPAQKIPAFLLKSISKSEIEKNEHGRR